MSQKTNRKNRKNVDEPAVKESEKMVDSECVEPEVTEEKATVTEENGTKNNEENGTEDNEETPPNSKESQDTQQNGTESEDVKQEDIIETEELPREIVETESVDVLPETKLDGLDSEPEEPVILNLVEVEENEEKITVPEKTDEIAENKDEKVLDDVTQEKEDIVNGNDTDSYKTETHENSVDTDDLSTQVVVGDDTTRNIDFTIPTESSMERSKFLNMSKDHSVGESIKYLTSRRSIRSIRNHYPMDAGNTYTLQRPESSGYKRKNYDETQETSKRMKTETPGLLSYLSQPFAKNNVMSSTPKLTGFKSNNFDNTNVSKISLNDTEKTENKWCTVM